MSLATVPLTAVSSSRTVDAVAAALPAAAARHGFGVIGGYDFRARMAEKGVPFDRDVRVVDLCNPVQAKRALEADLRVATVLPCRIAIWRDDAGTRVAALDPAAMASWFGSPALADVGHAVAPVIGAILREAAGS